MSLFEHVPHPWRDERQDAGPVKVADQAATHSRYTRFNSWLGLRITNGVGSMTCAYAFTVLALVSLPAAIESRSLIVIVAWIAQTLIQLVLLSIILFGQGLQSQAADARSEATYNDAEAILHGLDQQAQHLAAQDSAVIEIQEHLAGQDEKLAGLITQVGALLASAQPPGLSIPIDTAQ